MAHRRALEGPGECRGGLDAEHAEVPGEVFEPQRFRLAVAASEQDGVVSDQAIRSCSTTCPAPRSPASRRRPATRSPGESIPGMHRYRTRMQELWSIGTQRLP